MSEYSPVLALDFLNYSHACLARSPWPPTYHRCCCLVCGEIPAMLGFEFRESMYKPSIKTVSRLPTPLQIGSRTQQPYMPYATIGQTHHFERESRSSMLSTMDGIEVAKGSIGDIPTGELGLLTRRHEGMQRTKDMIYEQIADNQFPMEESEFFVRCFEKRADASICQTYYEGKRVNEISETAAKPRIGITFMAGADTPQVNRMEQIDMTSKTPEQKSALWRVNTAGTLLNDFEVDTDLSIIQSDQTAQVIARYRERNPIIDRPYSASNSAKHTLVARGWDDRTVTIHSDHVEIVSDLSARRWDLESTLIEVDGSSLTNLIVNYRHLIYRGGPALSFTETVLHDHKVIGLLLTILDQVARYHD